MAAHEVFLSFATRDTRKSSTGMLEAVREDFISHRIEDLVFNTFLEPLEGFDSLGLYCDEIDDIADQSIISHRWKSDFNASNIEKLVVSGGYGSVYKGERGMGKMPKRRKALVEAAAINAITVEIIRNLAAKKVDEIPRSVFCFCADSFPNLQKKKGSGAVIATLSISIRGEFTSSHGEWENFELLDLHLASSTRQPQPYSKMFSNKSKLRFITQPRTSQSEEFSNLSYGLVNGTDTTNKWSRGLCTNNIQININKQSPPAHPPPENSIFLRNYHMTGDSSIIALLITICMVTTFVAALGFSSSTFKDAYSTSKDLITSRLIIAMNTLVFIVSLIMDMFLLQQSTYKWEFQITLFALFGAYICLMKVMIPQAAFPLFLLSVPFLFSAAA